MQEVTTMQGLARVAQPLGPRLRVAREGAGLTREDLARRIGVQVVSIEAWEEGARAPRANRLLTMAGVLDVSLPWLLEGREDEYMETQGATTVDALRNELERLDTTLAEAKSTVERALERLDIISLRIRRGDLDVL